MNRAGRRAVATAGVLLTVVTAGTFLVSAGRDEGAAAPPTRGPSATATVMRGDMVATETVSGTLGYAAAGSVANRLAGTVTALAAEGTRVRRGGMLYAVDGRPVVLLYGKLPAYRSMSVGTNGEDVRQLERNLDALGYGAGPKVDDEYTAVTARAVRTWQKDLGLPRTGSVELGRVVFAADAVRVAEHKTQVGAPAAPGGDVFATTATRRVVTVDLPVGDQTLARRGAAVTVELPDGRTTKGKVSRVGTVARTPSDEASGGGSSEPTIDVEVTWTSRSRPASSTMLRWTSASKATAAKELCPSR